MQDPVIGWANDITSTEDTHINSLISMHGFDE